MKNRFFVFILFIIISGTAAPPAYSQMDTLWKITKGLEFKPESMVLLKGDTQIVVSYDFSFSVSDTLRPSVTIYDTRTGLPAKVLNKYKLVQRGINLAASPDGKYLAMNGVDTGRAKTSDDLEKKDLCGLVIDIAKDSVVARLTVGNDTTFFSYDPPFLIDELEFSKDGRYLFGRVTFARSDSSKTRIFVWDTQTWQISRITFNNWGNSEAAGYNRGIQTAPNNKYYSALIDQSSKDEKSIIVLFDINNDTLVWYKGFGYYGIYDRPVFSPDSTKLAVAYSGKFPNSSIDTNMIAIIDLSNFSILRTIYIPARWDMGYITFTLDSKKIIWGDYYNVIGHKTTAVYDYQNDSIICKDNALFFRAIPSNENNIFYGRNWDGIFKMQYCNLMSIADHGSNENNILYPNPSTNQVIINLTQTNSKPETSIYSNNGIKVNLDAKNIRFNGEQLEIDTSSLPEGTYFISIISNNQQKTYKMIKTN